MKLLQRLSDNNINCSTDQIVEITYKIIFIQLLNRFVNVCLNSLLLLLLSLLTDLRPRYY